MVEWEKERRYREHEEEIKRCAVKTFQRKREIPEWSKVTVIPVEEIEVSDELDSFVKAEILDGNNGYLIYPKWIQKCYVELRNYGVRLTGCTSISRRETKFRAKHVYLFNKDNRLTRNDRQS
jgi:hypothetical protein